MLLVSAPRSARATPKNEASSKKTPIQRNPRPDTWEPPSEMHSRLLPIVGISEPSSIGMAVGQHDFFQEGGILPVLRAKPANRVGSTDLYDVGIEPLLVQSPHAMR